ncbi:MAG: DMT family transporter [Chloroflexi bacterium]|nr:DMT family transporter [Chloroflexota bacterium]
MTNYLGEIAGIATSLFYALNSVFITRAGQQVGATVSNRTRVVFALLYLIILNLILFGQPLPVSADPQRWLWLSLSGVIGLALGDLFLFKSYLSIGPRLGNLLLSLYPIVGALEAWIFLDESLRLGQIVGILVTLAGIVWVVFERNGSGEKMPRHVWIGILYGVISAVFQATGFVFSKQGMYGTFSPFQGNAIRMSAALLALLVIALFQKQVGQTVSTLRANPAAFRMLMLAGFIGPVLGVSASLYAVQNAEVGVASTLTSLAPIFMLPISAIFFKERLGWQAIAGTLLAMVGVAILFLL